MRCTSKCLYCLLLQKSPVRCTLKTLLAFGRDYGLFPNFKFPDSKSLGLDEVAPRPHYFYRLCLLKRRDQNKVRKPKPAKKFNNSWCRSYGALDCIVAAHSTIISLLWSYFLAKGNCMQVLISKSQIPHQHILTSTHQHISTSAHHHILTFSHQHILTSAHPHILTSANEN